VTGAYRLVNEQHLYGVAAAFSVIMFLILLALNDHHQQADESDGQLCGLSASQIAIAEGSTDDGRNAKPSPRPQTGQSRRRDDGASFEA